MIPYIILAKCLPIFPKLFKHPCKQVHCYFYIATACKLLLNFIFMFMFVPLINILWYMLWLK